MKFDCTATRHHNSRAKATRRSATNSFLQMAGTALINACGMSETRPEELHGRNSSSITVVAQQQDKYMMKDRKRTNYLPRVAMN